MTEPYIDITDYILAFEAPALELNLDTGKFEKTPIIIHIKPDMNVLQFNGLNVKFTDVMRTVFLKQMKIIELADNTIQVLYTAIQVESGIVMQAIKHLIPPIPIDLSNSDEFE